MTKSDKVTVVVYPSGADADSLTVADAMLQVLDAFELLSLAEAKKSGQLAHVIWRLERATTNSPFTVEAVPLSSDPQIDVDRQASQASMTLYEGLNAVLKADSRADWIDHHSETILIRLLKRNLNGIGRTDLYLKDLDVPLIIDHRSALRGQTFLERLAADEREKAEDLTRREYGSVEGHVLSTATWYHKPAFRMKLRLSGDEVTCVLSPVAAEKIGPQRSWTDAWNGQRVLVSGICYYVTGGKLARIDVDNVQPITSRNVEISELRDDTFSNGLNPEAHRREVWGDERG
jgi:hypothetical protein